MNISLELEKQLKKKVREWIKERTMKDMKIKVKKMKKIDIADSLMHLAAVVEFLKS